MATTTTSMSTTTRPIFHYRIVELAQYILGQVDEAILQYYHEQWPNELDDFCPITNTDPCKQPPNHPPLRSPTPPPPPPPQPRQPVLEMITQAYTLVKLSFPEKQDNDILTAIILYYYSTVVLEYYALNDAEKQKVFLKKHFVSEDNHIIVTQDDQLFYVLSPYLEDDPAAAASYQPTTNKEILGMALELRKIRVKNKERRESLRFKSMSIEERTITLRLLSRRVIDYEFLQQPRYFLNQRDPDGQLLILENAEAGVFSNILVTIDGFFRRFQNKETHSLLFQITTCDEPWASQLRRIFCGLDLRPSL